MKEVMKNVVKNVATVNAATLKRAYSIYRDSIGNARDINDIESIMVQEIYGIITDDTYTNFDAITDRHVFAYTNRYLATTNRFELDVVNGAERMGICKDDVWSFGDWKPLIVIDEDDDEEEVELLELFHSYDVIGKDGKVHVEYYDDDDDREVTFTLTPSIDSYLHKFSLYFDNNSFDVDEVAQRIADGTDNICRYINMMDGIDAKKCAERYLEDEYKDWEYLIDLSYASDGFDAKLKERIETEKRTASLSLLEWGKCEDEEGFSGITSDSNFLKRCGAYTITKGGATYTVSFGNGEEWDFDNLIAAKAFCEGLHRFETFPIDDEKYFCCEYIVKGVSGNWYNIIGMKEDSGEYYNIYVYVFNPLTDEVVGNYLNIKKYTDYDMFTSDLDNVVKHYAEKC